MLRPRIVWLLLLVACWCSACASAQKTVSDGASAPATSGSSETSEKSDAPTAFPPPPTVTPTGEKCSELVLETRASRTEILRGVQPTVSMAEAIAVFAGVGIFASLIAYGFHMVRKHIYNDADNLDTTFDAGGKVSIGLTATTIVSQWTWSATLLQSSTVSSLYGISGPYWYAGGATIQIILFAVLSIQLKTRAPGAKTFLQVIHARFGPRTHQVYCVFAFLTNLVVMMSLTIAGTAVLNSLVADLSPEMAAMMLAIVIGGYTLIGGLGATFYVSYFNTALIFIMILMLVVEVYYNPADNPNNPFGSSERIFDFVECWKAPPGNKDGSYLTFLSQGGFIFGIVNIVGNFGTVFCDQAYWQSSVAAKPLQGVWGFILGGLTWFAIPFCLATTLGLSYLAMSSAQGVAMLSDKDVAKGLVAPMVAQTLLGRTGEYAMLFLILMAVMSTGSAEIIAVASIVIYDVYQIYLKPFRAELAPGECILCGHRVRPTNEDPKRCMCPSMQRCEPCRQDDAARAAVDSLVKPHYTCSVHGQFREYQERLLYYKNWSIVWTTFFSIPLCIFCWAVDLDLAWTYYFTGILISSAVVPIALSILWVRVSSRGMIGGAVGGCVCGITSWLVYASTYPGGLANFVVNTGHQTPMLIGNIVSVTVGGLVCIAVSLADNWRMTPEQMEHEWEKTRDIDNPLTPWVHVYRDCLDISEARNVSYHERPPIDGIVRRFRLAKRTAYGAGVCLTLLFVVIWTSSMIAAHPLDSAGFLAWTTLSRGWGFVAATFIIVVPLLQELYAIGHKWRKQQLVRSSPSDCLSLQSQCTSPTHSRADSAEVLAAENGAAPTENGTRKLPAE
ncbi:putative urea active transporter 1 [Amphibalanus amphitrite]|uniref:Putative urea active transporter 1 n=1 Tax=Amphibalanus amphitrite TaxID=1232801 RepID=A0A6A4W7L8_AMPAM|nr:putative urea active transporter 1 [Amphibalanus amphitrite]